MPYLLSHKTYHYFVLIALEKMNNFLLIITLGLIQCSNENNDDKVRFLANSYGNEFYCFSCTFKYESMRRLPQDASVMVNIL